MSAKKFNENAGSGELAETAQPQSGLQSMSLSKPMEAIPVAIMPKIHMPIPPDVAPILFAGMSKSLLSMRTWMDIEDAAHYLSVSSRLIKRWMNEGVGLNFVRKGGVVRFKRQWLDAFMEAGIYTCTRQYKRGD